MKEQKKRLIAILGHYYDLPNMINDELQQRRRYMGETEPTIVSVRESCQKRADALIIERDKVRAALEQLDRVEQRMIQMKYMGPQAPQERKHWGGRSPTWKEIAATMGYCDAGWMAQRAAIVMNKLCKALFPPKAK